MPILDWLVMLAALWEPGSITLTLGGGPGTRALCGRASEIVAHRIGERFGTLVLAVAVTIWIQRKPFLRALALLVSVITLGGRTTLLQGFVLFTILAAFIFLMP